MSRFTILIMCAVLFSLKLAAQTILLPFGSSWKYQDNGTNQGTTWYASAFNDNSWKSGTAKFGYGINDATTLVSYGSSPSKKYITTYFRKAISISDVSAYSSFAAQIKRDDGVVVYVNGVEVYRNNLPSGTITYSTLATDDVKDYGTIPQDFSIAPSAFKTGTNVIAVEVHQAKANSPDLEFDLELFGILNTPPANQDPQIRISSPSDNASITLGETLAITATASDSDGTVTKVEFYLEGSKIGEALTSPYTYLWTPTNTGAFNLTAKATDDTGSTATSAAIKVNVVSATPTDQTPPSVVSIDRYSPTTTTTDASSVTFRTTFSEPVSGVDRTDFLLATISGTTSGVLAADCVTPAGTDGIVYDITVSSLTGSGSIRLDLVSSGTGITDAAGNAISGGFISGQTYNVEQIPADVTAPVLNSVTLISDNSSPTLAKAGNTVTLSFSSSEAISTPIVTIAGHSVPVTEESPTTLSFTAVYTLTSTDQEGIVAFSVDFIDLAGNKGTRITATTNGSSVIFDKTAPTVLSIIPTDPATQPSNSREVTFRIVFSEPVAGVDKTDFSLKTVSGDVTGVLDGQAVASIDGISVYNVTVSVNGSGKLRLDFQDTNTQVTDAAGNEVTAGFTSGETYSIDQTPPEVFSIDRYEPTTETVDATSLIYRVTFSEAVTGVDKNDFILTTVSGATTAELGTEAVSTVGTDSTTYNVFVTSVTGNGVLRLDLKSSDTGIADAVGNTISGGFTSGQTYSIQQVPEDQTPPSVGSITRQNPALPNTNESTLTFRATFTEKVSGVDFSDFSLSIVSGHITGMIASGAVTAIGTEGTTYDITATSITGNGVVRLDLNSTNTGISDTAGNFLESGFVSGETYTVDQTAPTVVSINRQFPTTSSTDATSVTFRATFTEPVTGVDYQDFNLTIETGQVTASITSNAVAAVDTDGTTYDIIISSISNSGTLRLDLKSSDTGIADASGNTISEGFTSGQTYTIEQPAPSSQGFSSIVNLDPVPISTNTGEKPQSKVWTYDGKHWAVLPNSSGTYLWRLDGKTWTNVLKLSSKTTTKADCKLVTTWHIFYSTRALPRRWHL